MKDKLDQGTTRQVILRCNLLQPSFLLDPHLAARFPLCSRHMPASSLLHIHPQSSSSSSSLHLHALAESHVCAGLFLSRKSVISHSVVVLQLRESLKGRGLVLGSDDEDDADS